MSAPRFSPDKDVRAEAKTLQSLGFEFVRFGKCGRSHPMFRHPVYGEIGLASTPGDRNWKKAHRRKLAGLIGITVRELDARITGEPAGRRSGSRRRPASGQRSPRGLRHLRVAPETIAAPAARPAPEPVSSSRVLADHTGPITDARRGQWAALQADAVRANLANPFPWRTAA